MKVLFIGPLPPPVHGFSVINKAMLGRLQSNFDVEICDMRPGLGFAGFAKKVGALWALVANRRPGGVVYVCLSGGLRQTIDAIFLAAGRLHGSRSFIHHHSFSYLDRTTIVSRLVFRVARQAHHIVLCRCMADRLCAEYGIDRAKVTVLSNSAFVEVPDGAKKGPRIHGSLVLGFLSNISPEKGIREFAEIVRGAVDRNLDVRAFVAGPVHPQYRLEFNSLLINSPRITYVGPVYGKDKVDFFRSIDVLVFPTMYKNEAEPVTIFESLANGVPVVAFRRGCIQDILSPRAGTSLQYSADYVDGAVSALRSLSPRLDVAAESARLEFLQIAAEAELRLREIVSIVGGN